MRTREELCAVLVVPERTPSLDADIASMRLAWDDLGDGYWRVTGGLFALHVVEIDVVGPAEGDDLPHSLGHGKLLTREARWFWMELVGTKEAGGTAWLPPSPPLPGSPVLIVTEYACGGWPRTCTIPMTGPPRRS